MSNALWLALPEKTSVYSAPNADRFAVTTSDEAPLVFRQHHDGWAQVGFLTSWRLVEGWVRCPAVKGAFKGSHNSYRCTHQRDPDRVEVQFSKR